MKSLTLKSKILSTIILVIVFFGSIATLSVFIHTRNSLVAFYAEESVRDVDGSAMMVAVIMGLGVGVAAFAALILIAVLVSKYLSPLKDLVILTNELANGNYDARVKIGSNDDLHELGKSLNSMAFKLKKSADNVEKKISARTNELEKLNQIMVGRELKMIELKKQIKELKSKKPDRNQ